MTEVRLKRLFESVSGGSWGTEPEEGEVALPCVRGTDFDYQALRSASGTAPIRGFSRHEVAQRAARKGDLIIEKSGGGEKQPVGRVVLHDSDDLVMPTNFASRLKPSSDNESRFLAYLMSSLYAGGTTKSSIKQTTGIQNLDLHSFLDTVVLRPSLREQRAIADFLDTETARIDALIEKKHRMIKVLEERRTRILEELCAESGVILPANLDPSILDSLAMPTSWHVVRLSQALRQLTNGYVGPTRDILQSDGVPYIQGLHIKRGRIDFKRRPYYVSREWYLARPRIALRPKDVLIVQTGDIGQVALVPETIGEASCHALLIARVNQNVVIGPYLAAYLQSYFGYHSLLRMATGALHPHLESSIKDVRILVPPIEDQETLVLEIKRRQELLDLTTDRLEQQIRLLTEHRQALITAAVTGQV